MTAPLYSDQVLTKIYDAITQSIVVKVINGITGTLQPSGLTTAGKITTIAIDDTQWYLAPATSLAARNNIVIQNQSTGGGVMLWNYTNTAGATDGFQVPPGGSRSVAITGSIPVYIRMLTGSGIACIEELA